MSPLKTAIRSVARAVYVKVLLGFHPIWRYCLNLGPTLTFRRQPVVLAAEAARIVRELNKHGVAQTNLTALTGDPTLLAKLQAHATALETQQAEVIRTQQERLSAGAELGNGRDEKMFVITMLDHDRPVIEPDGIFATLTLHSQVKGIADHYYGMHTRITDINVWRNLPTGNEPTASQLWHRDLPEDYLILKMFVYLEDVTEGTGPYSYIKGTHAKGLRKWQPNTTHDGYNWRATDKDVAAATPGENIATYPGAAGTVLFTDTTGWHKGGHAKTGSRFVLQALFASKAALPDRMLGVPASIDLRDAPKELAYDPKTLAS